MLKFVFLFVLLLALNACGFIYQDDYDDSDEGDGVIAPTVDFSGVKYAIIDLHFRDDQNLRYAAHGCIGIGEGPMTQAEGHNQVQLKDAVLNLKWKLHPVEDTIDIEIWSNENNRITKTYQVNTFRYNDSESISINVTDGHFVELKLLGGECPVMEKFSESLSK